MMDGTLVWRDPWVLLVLAAALPLLIFVAARERRRAPALRFPLATAMRGAPRGLAAWWWLPHALRALAVIFAVLALARPQARGSRARDLSIEGIDIVVALDISTSMNAADFKPRDRISVAREVLRKFIDGRTNDRLGLVVFAGEAYTQAPLTLDYRVLGEILDSVRTGLIEDGTAIGNALATAVNRLCEPREEGPAKASATESQGGFCQGGAKSKVVILITDGDNNAGNISPMEATAIAKELGIRVYTIMVGRGGLVPFPAGKDFFGQDTFREVEIPVNPELLKSIARETDGRFYNAIDRTTLEGGLNDILDQLEKTKLYQAGAYENRSELFQPLLLLACLFVLAELALTSTRLRSFP